MQPCLKSNHVFLCVLVLHYQVHVYTGSQPNADTEANVYIMLFGERGDTGRRLLMRSDNDVTFQEGQVGCLMNPQR